MGAQNKKKTKASLCLATENIKGRGASTIRNSQKWKKLNDDIHAEKIGVIALQETHMTDAHVEEVHERFKYLHVVNSSLPENPTGAGGVALVFNKRLTRTENIETHVLIPGRALISKLEWQRGDELSILAVYGSTNKTENHKMWETIEDKIRASRGRIPKPDIMLGDFNFVEDGLDRIPSRLTAQDAPESFDSLRSYLRHTDGWRKTNPGTTEYTWRDPSRTRLSRLDRIYLTEGLHAASRNWKISLTDLNRNDHSRATCEIVSMEMPFVGPGRWTMREQLMNDEDFLEAVQTAGAYALECLERYSEEFRTEERNPQTIYDEFKRIVLTAAKRHMREINLKRNSHLQSLDRDRGTALNRVRDATTEEDREAASRDLRQAEDRIQDAKERMHDSNFSIRGARSWAEGETVSKSWLSWTKENTPRDTMLQLQIPDQDPIRYTTDTHKMADIAAAYHNDIQSKDIHPIAEEREEAILHALETITPAPTKSDVTDLGNRVTEENVIEAIKSAQCGKAAGIDGIIYELWKALLKRHEDTRATENPYFNVVEILTALFRDIEAYGLAEGSNFAEGWLCPFYKKGERTNIANYRPITLLNTDYKLFTKILSIKLGVVAQDIIDKSQAGFVKGRSITDHTKIPLLMTDYAEAVEENGMIIALDQEKAYDKVMHDYLIRVLRKFELPENFVKAVETLYGQAYTSVMINGVLSKQFKVTRGVRQGDPLSCLLFNLAIEPLSAMLRQSELRGYEIFGLEEKLIASLYADDTTVYLSCDDSFAELQLILNRWCRAAGAKFNVGKTEIIPLGTPEYRQKLIATRKLNDDDDQIPATIKITADGETIRVLGARPGNHADEGPAWAPILEKVDLSLSKWGKLHPTMNGRGILTQIYAAGQTQYLTAAQGMPRNVEKRLEKIVMSFVWEGTRRHPVNVGTLKKRKEDGGLNVFDAKTRNEAAYVVWLRQYLADPDKRPLWAYLADTLFVIHARKSDAKKIPLEARFNPFIQDWKPNKNKLPFILKQVLRVATDYGLAADAPYIPEEVRVTLPAWSHIARINPARARENTVTAKCLKENHAAYTVEALQEIAEQANDNHARRANCGCEDCRADRAEGCKAPFKCQEAANDILACIAGKWNPDVAQYDWPSPEGDAEDEVADEDVATGKEAPFPRRDDAKTTLAPYFRIFTTQLAIAPCDTATLARRDAGVRDEGPARDVIVTVVACGATVNGPTAPAKGGIAVHFPNGEHPDFSSSCAGEIHTEERSAALAILEAANAADATCSLLIKCNSKKAVRRLTSKLKQNEQEGWTSTPESADVFRRCAATLRRRAGETKLQYVPKTHENRAVKNLIAQARDAARTDARGAGGRQRELPIGLETFDKPGASLQHVTQRSAHRTIKLIHEAKQEARRRTTANLAKIRTALRNQRTELPTDAQIWASVKDKDISRNVRNFMWKGVHGAHKVGDYFTNMPQPWKEYEICSRCNCVESMEHILTQCSDPARTQIWKLARDFISRKTPFTTPTIGDIWGCGLKQITNAYDKRDLGAERAHKIVVSESAFLIWKARCERRIQHEDDPQWTIPAAEVTARWYHLINQRIAVDRLLTNKRIFKRKALKRELVLGTWRRLIQDEQNLPDDWIRHPGVLVGMGTPRERRSAG